MKKSAVFGVSLFVLFVFLMLNGLASAVRVNEIELNPEGTDSGNEWIELYSENEINLTGWEFVNSDNEIIGLYQNFKGYLIINLTSQWLDNSNEKIYLYNNTELSDETSLIDDAEDDNKTWQYCSGSWNFTNSTKGSVNSCETGNQDPPSDPPDSQDDEPKISMDLEWDVDEITNRREFDVKVKASNLLDEDYDIKVFITFRTNDTIISETYHEDGDKWRASKYYVEDVVTGSGNKSATISLRIDEDYENFEGDAKITARIRKAGTSSSIKDTEKNIKILKEENDEDYEEPMGDEENETEEQDTAEIGDKQTNEVIMLGNRNVVQETKNEKENKVLYESGQEKVKKYAVYFLNLVLVVIIILLIRKKV